MINRGAFTPRFLSRRLTSFPRPLYSDGKRQPIAVNLAFAVKLIFMPDALRQLHVGNFRVFRRNADLFTVEVVTVFDLPGQIKVMLVLLKIKSKGLIRGDKL